jgi:hypothetical protein
LAANTRIDCYCRFPAVWAKNPYFDEGDIPKITEGLAKCKEHLGEYTDKLDSYFEKRGGYNYHALSEAIGVPEEGLHDLLVWYARLELGRKIHECVKDSGSCSFEADL